MQDQQAGRRGREVARLEVCEILGAGIAEDALAALQLRVQRGEGALGQMRVEVGHEADGVGQVDAVLEGRAALVVDEQEREPVGRV